MPVFDPFVIPIRPKEKRPLETDWLLNTARLSEAAKRWPGIDRWGMPCGPINGVWCLDIDIKSHGPVTLAELERKHGPLPKTRETRTQSGGRHLYFRWDPERPIGSWVGRLPGLDTRGPGGQALIPPSEGYQWAAECDVADAPDWLYDALRVEPPKPGPGESVGADRPSGLPLDEAAALHDVRSYPPAMEGGRGAAVWKLAVRLVRGHGLAPDRAAALIEEHYNARCDPPWTGDELKAIDRACTRAADVAHVPWGFTFYQGRLNDVMLRAIRRYGPRGKEGSNVPYRVWPDGRMRMLDTKEGLARTVKDVCAECGMPEPSTEQTWRYVAWWKITQRSSGDFPTPLVLNDAPGPALARIVVAPGDTPAWDEFLTRLDEPEILLAWLWMLTLPQATRQVLWLYGEGADGKTVVATALLNVLGSAATTIPDDFMDASARWVGSQLYGRRLAIVEDTKMRQVLRRGTVHRITGRSPLQCEFKGVDSFPYTPNAAVLCTSNWHPLIGRGRADRTRLLEVCVRGVGQIADKDWGDRLTAELPALMVKARAAYEKHALKIGEAQLRVDLAPAVAARLDVAAMHDEDTYLSILEAAGMALDPAGEVKGREFFDRIPYKLNSPEYIDFRQWLEEHGVSQRRTADSRFWTGIKTV